MVRPPDAAEVAAMAQWDDLLRAYAEAIEQQRAFLLSVGSLDDVDDLAWTIPTFDIPADMPPMPASHEAWAVSLLAETSGLTELAGQVLAARPTPVRRPPRFAAATSGSTLDQKM